MKSEAKADGEHSLDRRSKAVGQAGRDEGRPTEVAEKKPDGGEGEPLSEEAKRKNLKKAVEQLKAELKSDDPRRRQTAEEFIRRYMENAPDPEVREAGKKALEEAGLPSSPDEKVAENKPKEPADSDGPPMGGKDKAAVRKQDRHGRRPVSDRQGQSDGRRDQGGNQGRRSTDGRQAPDGRRQGNDAGRGQGRPRQRRPDPARRPEHGRQPRRPAADAGKAGRTKGVGAPACGSSWIRWTRRCWRTPSATHWR